VASTDLPKEAPCRWRGAKSMQKFLALLLVLLLQTPQSALAHAALISTDPAGGAVLQTAPAQVTLHFNEPVSPLVFRWIDPDGAVQDLPPDTIHAGDGFVNITPPAALGQGTQTLSWRVASADGHPVGGTLSFAIGAASRGGDVVVTQTALPAAIARWALTTALVLGIGGAVFLAFVTDTTAAASRRIAISFSAAAVPLAGLAAGLQGADILGLPAISLISAAPWWAVATAPFARTAVLAILAAIMALVAMKRSGKMRWLVALAWMLAALSFAASGHATSWPKGIAVTLHALAMIFWIGALPGLALALSRGAAVPVLRRFSALALPLVTLLIGSGVALILTEVTTLSAFNTAWGQLLLVKLLLVGAMIALALLNRQYLTPALAAGGSPKPLRRSILAELTLGLIVLALASGFRLTGLPTPAAPPDPAPMLHIHSDRAMATVTLANGSRGPNSLSVDVADGDFGPLVPQSLKATLSLPSAGIEKLRLSLRQTSGGLWTSDPFTLPVAGHWDLTLQLLIDDFTEVSLTTSVEIKP
jgi:copper transport protein